MRRTVTKKQLEIIKKLQSNKTYTVMIGDEMSYISTPQGKNLGRADMRSVKGLINNGVLVAIQDLTGQLTSRYRLSAQAAKTNFVQSACVKHGGTGEASPTLAAIKEFVASHGGEVEWKHNRHFFFLTVGKQKVAIATERDLTPLVGIRHFSTMAEWERFFLVEIEDLKARQTNRDEK